MKMDADRKGRVLLAVGVLVGVLLAGADIVQREPNTEELGGDVIARVEGRPIVRADVARGVAALATDRREGARDEDPMRVLDRLIDEELLIQRALELGLAERDRRVRADLAAAMIDVIVSRAREEAQPDEPTLAAFYEAEAGYFRRTDRLRVEHVFFRTGESARQRAEAAAESLAAGRELGSIEADRPALPLRRGWLSASDLTQALGPSAAEIVAGLGEDEVSEPLATAEGVHVVRVVERGGGGLPPLSENRDVVLAEYRRRAGERALRAFLDERRGVVRVARAEGW